MVAELIGLSAIVGAFIAGVSLTGRGQPELQQGFQRGSGISAYYLCGDFFCVTGNPCGFQTNRTADAMVPAVFNFRGYHFKSLGMRGPGEITWHELEGLHSCGCRNDTERRGRHDCSSPWPGSRHYQSASLCGRNCHEPAHNHFPSSDYQELGVWEIGHGRGGSMRSALDRSEWFKPIFYDLSQAIACHFFLKPHLYSATDVWIVFVYNHSVIYDHTSTPIHSPTAASFSK